MNPEAEGLNGQADSSACKSSNSDTGTNGTLTSSLTLNPEACGNGTSNDTSPEQSPSFKKRLQHQSPHQGDSPKGSYACNILLHAE